MRAPYHPPRPDRRGRGLRCCVMILLLTLLPLLSAGPVRAAPAGAAMDDPKGTAGVDDPHLARIVGRSWPQTLTSSPVWATQLGDHRHDDRLPDRSAEALARGSVKDAAAEVAARTGLARKAVYARALELRRG